MSFSKITILTALALNEVSAAVNWGIGWCDPFMGLRTKPDFEVPRYMGTWYQVQCDKGFSSAEKRNCVQANYKYKGDEWWNPYPVEARNSNFINGALNTEEWIPFISQGIARCSWGNGDCVIRLRYYPEISYMVMDTDYDNYASVYSCTTWFGLWYTN
jgi:lipocalin